MGCCWVERCWGCFDGVGSLGLRVIGREARSLELMVDG